MYTDVKKNTLSLSSPKKDFFIDDTKHQCQ